MATANQQQQNQASGDRYDVVIVGGGMVGASLAVALIPLKLRVALVDAFEFGVAEQTSYDDRAIALSYGSSRIFQGMGLWQALQAKTTAIEKIHVSDGGHFGATRLTAKQEKVPALGYLVESKVLGKQLYTALENSDIEKIVPAKIQNIEEDREALQLTLEKDGQSLNLNTRLVVAADGSGSKVRELSGIEVKQSDYYQSAIISNVSTEKPHHGVAFERFKESGPIALLPMSDNRCSLVWTHNTQDGSADLDATMALDDSEFLKNLNQDFGYRLGRFTKAGKRSAYPLSLLVAEKNTAKRTVIIGNASHTLHPVAGQGLNLALRDIAVLADLLADKDLNISDLLMQYEELRQGDIKATVNYTDSLVRLFSNDNYVLGHARASGLLAVDRLSPLRNWLTRQSMGINYRQSRLARGLALRVGG